MFRHPDKLEIISLFVKQGGEEIKWLRVLIAFTVEADDKDMFLGCIEGWDKVQVTTDVDLAEKYYNSLRMIEGDVDPETGCVEIKFESDYKREDVFSTAYKKREGFLHYLEKRNVFLFHQYVSDSPVTRGAIEEIQKIRDGRSDIRFTEACHLRRVLEILDLCWD